VDVGKSLEEALAGESLQSASRFGKGSKAEGRLTGTGSLEVCGELRGSLDWSGRLLVAEGGDLTVSGRVEAIEVRGLIQGEIEVDREAFVYRGARWTGGASVPSMTTEAGAWLDGTFRVRPSDS
jgi:cytoskeletal protein CcmA (bactofilin family)